MKKITIYVGQALTDAPPEFRIVFQAELKSALRALPDIEVRDFVGLTAGTALEVYVHDRNCAVTVDFCVFVVDYASIGLGMEIMIRDYEGGAALYFAKTGRKVTRMLMGFLEQKGCLLHRYNEVADIVNIIKEYIQHLEKRD